MMVDDAAGVATLREIVYRAARTVAGGSTHAKLDEDLVAAGLPPSVGGGTKAERGGSSAAAVPDERLREVAVGLVERSTGLGMIDRMTVEDLVWADEHPPAIPKRTRRDIAWALPGWILVNHAQRFHALLATLFDLSCGTLHFGTTDSSLGGQIDRHFYRNDDWTVEQLFDELGAVDHASDCGRSRNCSGPRSSCPRASQGRPCVMPTTDRELASQPVHPLTPSSVRVDGFSLVVRRTSMTSEQRGSSISWIGHDERAVGQLRERRHPTVDSQGAG